MVAIDYSRDSLITEIGMNTLKGGYLLPGESAQAGFARAAKAFASDDAHAQRIYDYASRHWFMFSSPILSNAGREDGLPISCYLNHVEDSREGILAHYTENGWLSSNGGGIGANWSSLRADGQPTSKGGRSTGVIPFIKVADSATLAFSQGTSRRGSYAAYLDISHPEIEEFLDLRKSTGGDKRRKCEDIDHGVNIPDSFMKLLKEPGPQDWPLVDPTSGKVVKTIEAKYLWHRILQTRVETGEPYLHFIDTSNWEMAQSQKDSGLRINQSNLCTEIFLPTHEDRTAVCCLSSVNLTYYSLWRDDPQFIPDIVEYLDNVLDYFIVKAPEQFAKAKLSAMQERAIGLGAMGFHDLLQKRNIVFGSSEASALNREIFGHLRLEAGIASGKLGCKRGPAPESDSKRNVYLLAIAPNATSAKICGDTSPGIEPYLANIFTQKTAYGTYIYRNPNLPAEIWNPKDEGTMLRSGGSVQGMGLRNEAVFKTAFELDQMDIIKHAAERQNYICQGQSINLFFKADASKEYIARIHFKAWQLGLKSLYYLRSQATLRTEDISCAGCES